jgi:hypothetical protein
MHTNIAALLGPYGPDAYIHTVWMNGQWAIAPTQTGHVVQRTSGSEFFRYILYIQLYTKKKRFSVYCISIF